MFLLTSDDNISNLVTIRAIQILIISLISLLTAQMFKFVLYSIKENKFKWKLLYSTGGFPSSHSSFCVALVITLGMFQWHDLNGTLDWSFVVAVVFAIIVIHDAMGVRLEASKHAVILNRIASNLTDEEKESLGFGKNGKLKEMLGHKATEVLGGIILGVIIGLIGFFIAV